MDLFQPSCEFQPVADKHFLNPFIAYAIHCIITDPEVTCTKALVPCYQGQEDVYGLEKLFSLKMPNPETQEAGSEVDMLSWEFLSTLSTFAAMSPWYSWKTSPHSHAQKQPNLTVEAYWRLLTC